MSKRTTLTLEDDVATRLAAEARRTGKPVKIVANEALRRGLAAASREPRPPFRVVARELRARPGVEFDDIHGLIERVEGLRHR